jgi:hypothetical protein
MANSQYEYVKAFEAHDELLPHCWIVCRIDGIGFTKSVAVATALHAIVSRPVRGGACREQATKRSMCVAETCIDQHVGTDPSLTHSAHRSVAISISFPPSPPLAGSPRLTAWRSPTTVAA